MREKIYRRLLKINPREKLLLAVFLFIVFAYVVYGLFLSPYFRYYKLVRQELKNQKELLNLKIKKSKSLNIVRNTFEEIQNKLKEVNRYFFTEEEMHTFMKELPKVASLGNCQITSLTPAFSVRNLRSELILKYIKNLAINSEKKEELLEIIKKNQGLIDSTPAQEVLKNLETKIPEENRANFKKVWSQAVEDPLAALKIQKVDLEISMVGTFHGLVAFFDWLGATNKLIELNGLQIATSVDSSKVETKFVLSFYLMD